MVLDVVGGDYPARARGVLKPGGILVSTQPPSVGPVAIAAAERGIRVAGVIVEADEVGMSMLADLAATGNTLPLEEVAPPSQATTGPARSSSRWSEEFPGSRMTSGISRSVRSW